MNLSGQRNTNPWATSSWSPSTSGASKTVAQAQAERERRQKEREELNAAKRLQRVWRGHKDRQNFKQKCREEYDALYSQYTDYSPSSRVTSALPLLLVLFDPTRTDDQQRLDLFIQDLVSLGPTPTNFDLFSPTAWDRLAGLIVKALERYIYTQSHDRLYRSLTSSYNRHPGSPLQALSILVDVVRRRPVSISPILDRYYRLMSKLFEQSGGREIPVEEQNILTGAVTAPLISSSQGT